MVREQFLKANSAEKFLLAVFNHLFRKHASGLLIQILSKKLWEELIKYFPLIRHGPHRKRRFQNFFVAAGTCLHNLVIPMIGRYAYRHAD
jgi:hypothetical protein